MFRVLNDVKWSEVCRIVTYLLFSIPFSITQYIASFHVTITKHSENSIIYVIMSWSRTLVVAYHMQFIEKDERVRFKTAHFEI